MLSPTEAERARKIRNTKVGYQGYQKILRNPRLTKYPKKNEEKNAKKKPFKISNQTGDRKSCDK